MSPCAVPGFYPVISSPSWGHEAVRKVCRIQRTSSKLMTCPRLHLPGRTQRRVAMRFLPTRYVIACLRQVPGYGPNRLGVALPPPQPRIQPTDVPLRPPMAVHRHHVGRLHERPCTRRVRVRSRRSRSPPGAIHTVGSVPLRCSRFNAATSSLSVLLIIPTISLAFRGCTRRGTNAACSISETIQQQLPVASTATGVPRAQPSRYPQNAPGRCSMRHCLVRPVRASWRSAKVWRLWLSNAICSCMARPLSSIRCRHCTVTVRAALSYPQRAVGPCHGAAPTRGASDPHYVT